MPGKAWLGSARRGTAWQGLSTTADGTVVAFSIDDRWDFATAVVRAGNAAFGVYCRAGAWAAGHSSDGFVPAEVTLSMGSPELTSKLVSVGLWEAVDGGYLAVHFLERNESAEQASARRDRERARKAKWRAKKSPPDGTRKRRGRPTGQDGGLPLSFTPPKGGSGRASDAKPHPFLDNGNGDGWCTCGLPRVNKIHSLRRTA